MYIVIKPGLSIRTTQLSKFGKFVNSYVCKRNLVNTATIDENQLVENENDEAETKELFIEQLRDKSRLKPEHRNILFNCKPFSEPAGTYHETVKYNQKLYGKYGSESGVNPGIMWPTKSDIALRREYESVAYPYTIEAMVALEKEKKETQEKEDKMFHDRTVANLAKLDQWKQELKDKLAKKEAEALAAKEKKDRLIEDVRRHFGYTVDPRDERFKEMLALKEKEQKKKDKQVRMQEREKKAIAKLMAKNEAGANKESN